MSKQPETPKAATPHGMLVEQLLDSRIPKTEREHAATREIGRLREENQRLLAANRDCLDHFNQIKEDYDALRAQTADHLVDINKMVQEPVATYTCVVCGVSMRMETSAAQPAPCNPAEDGVCEAIDCCNAAAAQEPAASHKGPEELWLQLHGNCTEEELTEPVDYTDDSVTWCWHQIHDSDARYIRADLATPPAAPVQEPVAWDVYVKHGRIYFSVGNQSFPIDYTPEDEPECSAGQAADWYIGQLRHALQRLSYTTSPAAPVQPCSRAEEGVCEAIDCCNAAQHANVLLEIKRLLSRDPCVHAKVAIEMIDTMLAAPEKVGAA